MTENLEIVDENLRLLAVKRFQSFDLQLDAELQELISMASDICNTPVALITLLDEDTQWIKVRKGTDVEQMPRDISFCTHAIEQDDIFTVEDAFLDERFAGNPIVAERPNIRFYAGAPLITHDGYRLGTLCVVDQEPHTLDGHQKLMLKMLSKQAINIMELKVSHQLLQKNQREVEESRKAVHEAEIKLRSFFESSANMHVLLGKNCEVIDYNKTAYNFIRLIHNTKLNRGAQFIEYLHQSIIISFVENYKKAILGEKIQMEGKTIYDQVGEVYWEASFEPALDNNENIIGISYIVRNISDRKLHEKKILAQNESLMNIAYIQSHEYRGPLTSVMGLLNLIREEDYQAPREYLIMLETAVNRLDAKISEVVSIVNNLALEEY